MEFFNGTVKIGETTTAPYSMTWKNVAAGTYSITAIATDNQYAATTSSAVIAVVSVLLLKSLLIQVPIKCH